MTLEQALTLHHGQVLYHKRLRNRDGSPLRGRVAGRVKTWKTRPDDVRIPMKHGLRDCFYLTQHNLGEWSLTETITSAEGES